MRRTCVARERQNRPASVPVCGDGTSTRGEVEIDAGQSSGHAIARLWLEPPAQIHRATAALSAASTASIIGPGSFYTSLMPHLPRSRAPETIRSVQGPLSARHEPADRGSRDVAIHGEVMPSGCSAKRSGVRSTSALINTSRPSAGSPRTLSCRAQGPLEIGQRSGLLRGGDGRLLVPRYRAPRSASAGAGLSGRCWPGGCSGYWLSAQLIAHSR